MHVARRPLVKNFDNIFSQQMKKMNVVPKILKSWHIKREDHVLRYVNSNYKENIKVVCRGSSRPIKITITIYR